MVHTVFEDVFESFISVLCKNKIISIEQELWWLSGFQERCVISSQHTATEVAMRFASHIWKKVLEVREHTTREERYWFFWCFYNYWCFSSKARGFQRLPSREKSRNILSLKSNQHFCAFLCFFRKTKSGIERKRQWVWEIGIIHQDKRFVNWFGHFQPKGCNYRNKFTALQK